MPRVSFLPLLLTSLGIFGFSSISAQESAKPARKPNFLFVISDDQSAMYTSFAGDPVVKTPTFDRIARDGVYFPNAFASSPSCSPSRGAILTGRNQWELKESSVIACGFPGDLKVYQDLLWDAGYFVGFTGKGWGPGQWVPYGRKNNPAGIEYNRYRSPEDAKDFRLLDYARNFEHFLKDRNPGQPFSFWMSPFEPHRASPSYKPGAGQAAGIDPSEVVVPDSLYDYPGMRSDITDYLAAIQVFDRQLADVLRVLEESGELENTVIVVTSDNGMPFPRAKSNLYDLGVRQPLAVMWKEHIKPGRVVEDFINLADIAPTFLELAGVQVPDEMTARSFAEILFSDKSGMVDPSRDFVATGLEVHDSSYPMRAIRTHDFLYIMNLEPGRNKWPKENQYIWGQRQLPPSEKDAMADKPVDVFYGTFQGDPEVGPFVERAYGKRPPEELYDVRNDPWQMKNLAGDPKYADQMASLKARLTKHLESTGDPRFTGGPILFEQYLPWTKELAQEKKEEIRAWAIATREHNMALKRENRKRGAKAEAPQRRTQSPN